MSIYLKLATVSDLLRRTLWTAFSAYPALQAIVPAESAIVFTNPTETSRNASNRLSLWLYQITENELVKNQPAPRGRGYPKTPVSPVTLNLDYLLTPYTASSEADLVLLGRVMKTLYDNPFLQLQDDSGTKTIAEVRITINHLSLEELTRVWEALREPYRLSAAYQVRVTQIG